MVRVPLHCLVLATGHHPLDQLLIDRLVRHLFTDPRYDTEPVHVEPDGLGRLVLCDGRHRYTANLIAGRPDLPATIRYPHLGAAS